VICHGINEKPPKLVKYHSFEDPNQKALFKKKKKEIKQNSENCFYFYQATSGENIFLHPLCFNILAHD
jgi:hypothetical protein